MLAREILAGTVVTAVAAAAFAAACPPEDQAAALKDAREAKLAETVAITQSVITELRARFDELSDDEIAVVREKIRDLVEIQVAAREELDDLRKQAVQVITAHGISQPAQQQIEREVVIELQPERRRVRDNEQRADVQRRRADAYREQVEVFREGENALRRQAEERQPGANNDLERKLHHVHVAMEHLQAAGLGDHVEQLRKTAERLERAMHEQQLRAEHERRMHEERLQNERLREDRLRQQRERVDHNQAERRELHEALQDMREHMERMHHQMEELHQQMQRWGERIEKLEVQQRQRREGRDADEARQLFEELRRQRERELRGRDG